MKNRELPCFDISLFIFVRTRTTLLNIIERDPVEFSVYVVDDHRDGLYHG